MQTKPTRRGLIAGAVALAGAAAGAGASAAAATAALPAEALADAIELERVGVIAYRRSLASGVLTPAAQSQLRVLLAQELIHVSKLEQALSGLGAAAPRARSASAPPRRSSRAIRSI